MAGTSRLGDGYLGEENLGYGTELQFGATAVTFTFTTFNATITKDRSVSATSVAFTFAKQNPVVAKIYNVSATVTAFTFTQYNTTVAKSRNANATATAFTFAPINPTIAKPRNADTTTAAFSFSTHAATVAKGAPVVTPVVAEAGGGAHYFTTVREQQIVQITQEDQLLIQFVTKFLEAA